MIILLKIENHSNAVIKKMIVFVEKLCFQAMETYITIFVNRNIKTCTSIVFVLEYRKTLSRITLAVTLWLRWVTCACQLRVESMWKPRFFTLEQTAITTSSNITGDIYTNQTIAAYNNRLSFGRIQLARTLYIQTLTRYLS